MQKIQGSCHCGNIQYVFKTALQLSEIPIRACTCKFCTKHGAKYASDPKGKLQIRLKQPALLQQYQFSTQSANFLLCRR